MGPPSEYPTVIIGGGLGGLCCGAYLAKQGIPVTLEEQHSVPGGYATCFERAGGKFRFGVSLHGTSINNNAGARILGEIGVLEKLELVELPELYRLKTPRLVLSVPPKDPETYIRLLAGHFPAEAEGIRGFVREMIGIAEEADRLHQKKGRFFKLIFPIQYRRMWNVRHQTLADLMNDYVQDPELQNLLTALWSYYGLPPSRLSAFYYAVATGGYLKNGSHYIKQRSQDLSDALVEAIENNGGKVWYDSPVQKILVRSGAVEGVALSDGTTLPATAVVSNASALTTFQEMLPREVVPGEYLKKLAGYRPSISTFIVWLGLNRSLRGQISACSTYVSSGRGPEADYQASLSGDIGQGSFGVSIYDNMFEGYSRPGTSTLMLVFLSGYEPWRKFESDYHAGRKEEYRKEKARWTDVLIRRAAEEVVPGLETMIAVQEAATPLTNRRCTGNTEGAIYGFE
ncbi:MAG: NAD(P)/FAD-dependent oxidoreductase [Desulfobacterales bacterium]|nr:MAG: NAD(P)/FAD-dependent oxidoreductase [Desulfobacterales bacterium]